MPPSPGLGRRCEAITSPLPSAPCYHCPQHHHHPLQPPELSVARPVLGGWASVTKPGWPCPMEASRLLGRSRLSQWGSAGRAENLWPGKGLKSASASFESTRLAYGHQTRGLNRICCARQLEALLVRHTGCSTASPGTRGAGRRGDTPPNRPRPSHAFACGGARQRSRSGVFLGHSTTG